MISSRTVILIAILTLWGCSHGPSSGSPPRVGTSPTPFGGSSTAPIIPESLAISVVVGSDAPMNILLFPSSTVYDLKKAVRDKSGLSIERQKLMMGSVELADNAKPLSAYNVTASCIVNVILL